MAEYKYVVTSNTGDLAEKEFTNIKDALEYAKQAMDTFIYEYSVDADVEEADDFECVWSWDDIWDNDEEVISRIERGHSDMSDVEDDIDEAFKLSIEKNGDNTRIETSGDEAQEIVDFARAVLGDNFDVFDQDFADAVEVTDTEVAPAEFDYEVDATKEADTDVDPFEDDLFSEDEEDDSEESVEPSEESTKDSEEDDEDVPEESKELVAEVEKTSADETPKDMIGGKLVDAKDPTESEVEVEDDEDLEECTTAEFVNESKLKESTSMPWDLKVATADDLLSELCKGLSVGEDDTDGYWESDDTWCCKNIYYVSGFNEEDIEYLEATIPTYDSKLDNCTFYYYIDGDADTEFDEDNDLPCEVGYQLTQTEEDLTDMDDSTEVDDISNIDDLKDKSFNSGKQYEILFHSGKTEVVTGDEAETIALEADACERDDISQIHELEADGSLGITMWTDEEGFDVSESLKKKNLKEEEEKKKPQLKISEEEILKMLEANKGKSAEEQAKEIYKAIQKLRKAQGLKEAADLRNFPDPNQKLQGDLETALEADKEYRMDLCDLGAEDYIDTDAELKKIAAEEAELPEPPEGYLDDTAYWDFSDEEWPEPEDFDSLPREGEEIPMPSDKDAPIEDDDMSDEEFAEAFGKALADKRKLKEEDEVVDDEEDIEDDEELTELFNSNVSGNFSNNSVNLDLGDLGSGIAAAAPLLLADDAGETIDDEDDQEELVEHVNEENDPVESDQELQGTDNAVNACKVNKVITHADDEIKELTESFTFKEMTQFMDLCKKLGLKTSADVKKYVQEHNNAEGQQLLQIMADDVKNKENTK